MFYLIVIEYVVSNFCYWIVSCLDLIMFVILLA